MQKLKIKILKNHEASVDGIRIQEFKKGEILELGSPRLSLHLYEWHVRNPGFSEEYSEEKAIGNAPENKMFVPQSIENKEESTNKTKKRGNK